MARGLITGGYAFALFALGCSVLVGYWPMYLVSRTELVGEFCWEGMGIWQTRYRWGDEIKEIGYACSPEAGGAMSTHEAYCDAPGRKHGFSANFREQMCSVTNWSKVCVVTACAASATALLCAFLASFDVCGIWTAMSVGDLPRKQWFTGIGSFSSFVGAAALAVILLLMSTSPLLGQENLHLLSKGFPLPYKGISCVYQTPLPSWKKLSLMGPMRCLFPGPTFAVCVMGLVALCMATLLFGLKYREVRVQRKNSLLSDKHGGVGLRQALGQEHMNEDLFSHLLRSPSTSMPSHTPGLPNHFLYDRHYSLYGAFKRRFHKQGRCMQHLITAPTPLLVVLATMLLAATCLIGIAYGLFITFEVVKHKKEDDANVDAALEALAQLIEALMPMITNRTVPGEGLLGDKELWHLIQQLTEFAPVTLLRTFVDGGVWFLGITTLVSSFIWPSLKAIIWLWFWFAPADETWRGRCLTWIDSLGKLSLPNLFVITLVSVTNHWYGLVVIPWWLLPLIVPPNHSLQIRVELALNPGLGTLTYTVSYLFSLILGEIFVALHRKCKAWEEQWRDAEDLRWRSSGSSTMGESMSILSDTSVSDAQLRGYSPIPRVSPDLSNPHSAGSLSMQVEDTPFFMMYRSHRRYHQIRSPSATAVAEAASAAGFITTTEGLNSQLSTLSNTNISDCVAEQLDFYETVESEALCSRMISPLEGEHHRYTLCGKVFVSVLLVITCILMGAAMQSEIIEVERKGLAGKVVVKEEYRVTSYSILDVPSVLQDLGGDNTLGKGRPVTSFKVAFVLFAIVMPFVHLLGLVCLWLIPMRSWTQKTAMHIIEILGAWSAVDIFTIVVLGMNMDIEKITNTLINTTSAGIVNDIIAKIFPGVNGLYGVAWRLRPGVIVLVVAVICEKIVQHFIVLQFATMVAERTGLQELRKEQLIRKHLGARDRARAQSSNASSPYQQLSMRMIDNHLNVISPAARFYTASNSKVFYAGQFLFVWRLLVRVGILRPVEHIHYFTPPFEVTPRFNSGLQQVAEEPLDDNEENFHDFSLDEED